MQSPDSLGFGAFFSAQNIETRGAAPARIAAEERDLYRILGARSEIARLSGRLRHTLGPMERPVVGDWVLVAETSSAGLGPAVIQAVYNRRTALVRRAAGSDSSGQVVAANVDVFFVVTSANRDLNVRRLERYLTAIYDSGASPMIVLNKIDLGGDLEAMIREIEQIALGVPVLPVSAVTGAGIDLLRRQIAPGNTAGFIGSSGVGKSSLTNLLLGKEAQEIRALRTDGKGRHTTARRELFVIPGGGLLMDTPGMREFGLIEDAGGLESCFEDIARLAAACRFRDCRHKGEPGCAVLSAVDSGTIPSERLDAYRRLEREIAAAERKRDPAFANESKRRWKAITKAARVMQKTDPKRRTV